MLLRRVIEHVKDQNWFAVVIDFIIVVVGVFIGIQVANWNDARGERAAEAGFLEALAEDTQSSIAHLESVVDTMQQAQDARGDLYAYGLDPDAILDTEEINGLLQASLFNIQRLNIQQVAYEALKSSGQLSIIADSELASELQALDASIAMAEHWEEESIQFTYDYTDRYLIAEADTENLMITNRIGSGDDVPWIRGNDNPSLTKEQLSSVRFRNLLLYQAEITRGRLRATNGCLQQHRQVLALIEARQAELESS